MRRLLLSLAFAALTWSQDLRGPRPEPPPPVAVKVEMPTESIASSLLKIVIPVVLGSALTLLGVWLTNRRNAAENEVNRKHQLELELEKARIAAEAKSRDRQWDFRKDVYVKLVSALGDLRDVELRLLSCAKSYTPETESMILSEVGSLLPALPLYSAFHPLSP